MISDHKSAPLFLGGNKIFDLQSITKWSWHKWGANQWSTTRRMSKWTIPEKKNNNNGRKQFKINMDELAIKFIKLWHWFLNSGYPMGTIIVGSDLHLFSQLWCQKSRWKHEPKNTTPQNKVMKPLFVNGVLQGFIALSAKKPSITLQSGLHHDRSTCCGTSEPSDGESKKNPPDWYERVGTPVSGGDFSCTIGTPRMFLTNVVVLNHQLHIQCLWISDFDHSTGNPPPLELIWMAFLAVGCRFWPFVFQASTTILSSETGLIKPQWDEAATNILG